MARIVGTPGRDQVSACIFCGSDDLREEHIVADWVIRAFFQSKKRKADLSGYLTSENQMRVSTAEPIQTARVVCEPCNNRWLSRLDNAASKALKSFVRGNTSAKLNREQQEVVAAWVFKCALIFDVFQMPRNGALASLRSEFAEERLAPPGCVVVIGPSPVTPMKVDLTPERLSLAMFGIRPISGEVRVSVNAKQSDGSMTPAEPIVVRSPGWEVMLGRVRARISGVRAPIVPTSDWNYARIWPASSEHVLVTSTVPEGAKIRPPD